MNQMNSNYLLSVCAGIISICIIYLENKYSKKNTDKISYLKLFILFSILTLLVLYINNNFSNIPSINNLLDKQEIMTGKPNF